MELAVLRERKGSFKGVGDLKGREKEMKLKSAIKAMQIQMGHC